jgi:hypothetical protein
MSVFIGSINICMQNPVSPYETKKAHGPQLDMPTHGQEMYKMDDEMKGKAPPTLTFPLETLVQFVGNMLVTLTQARTALNVAGEHPEADKKALADIVSKLDEVNVILISLPEDLEKLSL